MNRIDIDPSRSAAECSEEFNRRVQQNPLSSVLIAVGAGVLLALLVRALRPEPPPTSHLSRLLEDIRDRLDDARPALARGKARALDAVDALRDGVHHGEARVERFLNQTGDRLRKLFS